MQQFLLGVDMRLDGSLVLAPTVTEEFWKRGFGQTLVWHGRNLRYRMLHDRIEGTYAGSTPQRVGVRLPPPPGATKVRVTIDDRPAAAAQEKGLIFITLPATRAQESSRFEILRSSSAKR
jgi:hypothetical protein